MADWKNYKVCENLKQSQIFDKEENDPSPVETITKSDLNPLERTINTPEQKSKIEVVSPISISKIQTEGKKKKCKRKKKLEKVIDTQDEKEIKPDSPEVKERKTDKNERKTDKNEKKSNENQSHYESIIATTDLYKLRRQLIEENKALAKQIWPDENIDESTSTQDKLNPMTRCQDDKVQKITHNIRLKNKLRHEVRKINKKHKKQLEETKLYQMYKAATNELNKYMRIHVKHQIDEKMDVKALESQRIVTEGPIRRFFEFWCKHLSWEGLPKPVDELEEHHSFDFVSLLEAGECKIMNFVQKIFKEKICVPVDMELPLQRPIGKQMDQMWEKLIKNAVLADHTIEIEDAIRHKPRIIDVAPVKTRLDLKIQEAKYIFYKKNWWGRYTLDLHPWERNYTYMKAIMKRSYVMGRKYWKQNYAGRRKRLGDIHAKNRPRSPWR